MIKFIIKLISGFASLPDNSQRISSYALKGDWEAGGLGYLNRGLTEHPGKNGIHLLSDGVEAFAARLALIELARTSIDIQSYLFHADLTGQYIAAALLNAADNGVRVRVLVDDMDLSGRDHRMRMLASHHNIQIRIFNPFTRGASRMIQFLSRFGSVTRRMHNKSLSIDGLMTIVGGRNIGDEYFSANPIIEFGDLDVLVAGPVVKDVNDSFDEYWNSPLAYPIEILHPKRPEPDEVRSQFGVLRSYQEEVRESEYVVDVSASGFIQRLLYGELHFDWVDAWVYADTVEKILNPQDPEQYSLLAEVGDYIDRTRDELIIISPYFVPGRAGVDYFSELVDRGVRVRILTNSLASNDVAIVHSGYSKYRKGLIRAGVELYELNSRLPKKRKKLTGKSRSSLHAKAFIMDRHRNFVGSLNLDPRSVAENTEIGVLFNSRYYGAGIASGFDAIVQEDAFRVEFAHGSNRLKWTSRLPGGEIVVFAHEPYTGYLKRLGNWMMSLLPIESQL